MSPVVYCKVTKLRIRKQSYWRREDALDDERRCKSGRRIDKERHVDANYPAQVGRTMTGAMIVQNQLADRFRPKSMNEWSLHIGDEGRARKDEQCPSGCRLKCRCHEKYTCTQPNDDTYPIDHNPPRSQTRSSPSCERAITHT